VVPLSASLSGPSPTSKEIPALSLSFSGSFLTPSSPPTSPSSGKLRGNSASPALVFHQGELPGFFRGGYLKRLERKAFVHKWVLRWFKLDAHYLSVYANAAEATKDKSDKRTLQQYRLYDIEEITLARNLYGQELLFRVRLTDRQLFLTSTSKNLIAKWMLAIDTVAHRRNHKETAYLSKLVKREVYLRRLFLNIFKEAVLTFYFDEKEHQWGYVRDKGSSEGRLEAFDGSFSLSWDGENIRPLSDKTCGFGVWDSVWLTWYRPDKSFFLRYQWHTTIEEFHVAAAANKRGSSTYPPFRYNGKIFQSRDTVYTCSVRGEKVPPPIIMAVMVLYFFLREST
jgi:hypothetical protein